MPKTSVLLELRAPEEPAAFEMHREAVESATESMRQSESLLRDFGDYGLEIDNRYAPVPLFSEQTIRDADSGLESFRTSPQPSDLPAQTVVVAADVDDDRIEDLRTREDVIVWPNSDMELFQPIDCPPFRAAVTIDVIRKQLGVHPVWEAGFQGQNVGVAILDSGLHSGTYPIAGGFPSATSSFPAGGAPITSHGCMCAAGVRTSAPGAQLFDYRFVDNPNSGGALRMFQAILFDRKTKGRPHITSNSYGFVQRPPQHLNPLHEIWNINHVIHRKVREVVASGAVTFFAAGNCGAQCAHNQCQSSSIGPGASIHASNSLAEVITVAAVNIAHERLGYSGQGPGGFFPQKPDVSAYTHYFGNFGPGRPGGASVQPFDNGTSAATPLAAGVAALLLNARPNLTPDQIKRILIQSAVPVGAAGWNPDTGFGVINAAKAFALLS